jgi:hypothetical protein
MKALLFIVQILLFASHHTEQIFSRATIQSTTTHCTQCSTALPGYEVGTDISTSLSFRIVSRRSKEVPTSIKFNEVSHVLLFCSIAEPVAMA